MFPINWSTNASTWTWCALSHFSSNINAKDVASKVKSPPVARSTSFWSKETLQGILQGMPFFTGWRLEVKSPVPTMHRVGMRRRVATPDCHVTSSSSRRMNHPSWHHGGSNAGPNRGVIHSHSSMSDWIPSEEDVSTRSYRCWRRRIFMIITEPDSSALSAAFYVILMSAIFVVNTIMVMQTMESWQYTPKNCVTCGGYVGILLCCLHHERQSLLVCLDHWQWTTFFVKPLDCSCCVIGWYLQQCDVCVWRWHSPALHEYYHQGRK